MLMPAFVAFYPHLGMSRAFLILVFQLADLFFSQRSIYLTDPLIYLFRFHGVSLNNFQICGKKHIASLEPNYLNFLKPQKWQQLFFWRVMGRQRRSIPSAD